MNTSDAPKPATESNELLTTLQKILAGQEGVIKEVGALRAEVAKLAKQIAERPQEVLKKKELLPVELTAKQQEVLGAMNALEAEDPTSLKKANKILEQLHGDALSRSLIVALRDCLKSKSWGCECSNCGVPSRILWNTNPAYSTGGCLQFAHALESGGTTHHSGHTTFPSLKIVSRIVHSGKKPKIR